MQGRRARRAGQLVASKQPRKYDEAVSLLKDIRDLSLRDPGQDLTEKFRAFFARHAAKPAFQRRLQEAGFGV